MVAGWLVFGLGGPGFSQVGPAPVNLAVEVPAGNLAESQLLLRWDPVPGALGYEVLQRRGDGWWLNESDPGYIPVTNSTAITGLLPNQEFEFCVRAVLPGGLSANSAVIRARTAVGEPVKAVLPQAGGSLREEPLDLNAPIGDLVPAPVRKAPPQKKPERATPEGPPPPAPGGLMVFFSGDDKARLSWRKVSEATGYLVEEEREGRWQALEKGVVVENQPWIVLSGYPSPGPYHFRVRSLRGGQQSPPSLPARLER